MGFFDRLFGNDDQPQGQPIPQPGRTSAGSGPGATGARSDDEIALERYRYLLRTAPPETIEQVHQEAFSRLTPQQRDLLFQQLTENAPAGDAPRGPDAASLATSATRSELRNPGTLERSLGDNGRNSLGGNGGPGFGSMFASSLLGSVAGYVIASSLVGAFMPDAGGDSSAGADGNGDSSGSDSSDSDSSGSDSTEAAGADSSGADSSSTDASGADGGDFGGGDFGGGDFGGGDFGGDFGGF